MIAAGVVGGILVTTSKGSAATRPLIVTAEAQRRTLQEKLTLTGQLSRVLQRNVSSATAAQVSRTEAKDGDVIQAGKPILTLDGRDAVAEPGMFSFFRSLSVGDTGEDVSQLDTILASAGYNPGPISTLFTEQTRSALGQWQTAHGYPSATSDTARTVTVSLAQGGGYKLGPRDTAGLVIAPTVATTSYRAGNGTQSGVSPAVLTSFEAPLTTPDFTLQSLNAQTPKGSPATFVVYASASSSSPIDFEVTLGGDAGPNDVLPPLGPLTLAANTTSVEFQVPTRANGLVESNRTLIVSLKHDSGYSVGSPSSGQTVIISSDVPQITLSGSASVTDGQSATLTVHADQAPVQDTQIALNVSGNATVGKDYTPVVPYVTLPSGQTSATFNVSTLTDGTIEANKLVVVSLAPGGGYKLGPIATAAITILGAEGTAALPVVTLQTATAYLQKGQPFVLTLSLSEPLAQQLPIQLVYGGTAQAQVDYTIPGGQIVVPAGQTTLQVQVPTVQDNAVEADRVLFVSLGPSAAYTVGSPNVVAAQISNQNVPKLTIVAAAAQIAEGSGTTFIITADQAPAKDTSVNFELAGTAQAGVDYQPITSTVLLSAGQTSVSVSLLTLRKGVVFQPTDMIAGQWPTRIGQVLVKQGDLAAPGTPLFTLTDTSYTVTLSASASDRTKLTLGEHVTVELSGGSTQVDGVIAELDDNVTVDPKTQAQTYQGKISVIGNLGAADGATVTIGVTLNSASNVVTVPIAAVKQNGEGRDVVRVIDLTKGGHVSEVPVATGVSDDSYIEIRSGLRGGEVVIVEMDKTTG